MPLIRPSAAPAPSGALPPPPNRAPAAPAAAAPPRPTSAPPAPARAGALPPPPPARGPAINPAPFDFDDNAEEVIASMGAVPLADIPQLKAQARKRLEAIGIRDSVEVAHLTIAYLKAAGIGGTVADDILAVSEGLRSLHNVETPAPFVVCPELGEPVASAAEIAAPLPPLPGAAPLAAARIPLAMTPEPTATEPRKTVTVYLGNGPAVLYIECQPVRGRTFTLLEDWIGPMLAEVAADAKVPHYRLIAEYGAASAGLARRVQEKLSIAPPEHLVVLFPYSEGAKAVLDLLIAAYPVVIRR